MKIDWYKCEGDIWCDLEKVDAANKLFNQLDGVYVIWIGSLNRTVLRIGHGNIRSQISANKNDLAVRAFSHLGVYITWCKVSENNQKGIHAYLSKTMFPKIMDNVPKVNQIEVNLPW